MLKISIYNKIYTLDKILRKVGNYNTVILIDKRKSCLFTAEPLQQLLLLEIY